MVVKQQVSENQWERTLVSLARVNGWKVAGFRTAQVGGSWQTPVRHDAKGWPDLVLVRDRVIFVELKTDRGRVRPEQHWWIDVLEGAGQEVYVWRPSDWDEAVSVLRKDREWKGDS
jgi:hypothetical protein